MDKINVKKRKNEMKMTSDEMKTRAENLARDGKKVSVFGKSCIFTENYADRSHFTFFDYDTPIFDVYVHGENDYVHPYKLQGWKFSATTTRHTKIAIDIIALAIYARYGMDVEPDTVFAEIDKGEKYYE